jgi:hypothetical protein
MRLMILLYRSRLLLAGLLVFSMLHACSSEDPGAPSSSSTSSVSVKYEVSGSMGTLDHLSYTNATGGDTSEDDVSLPWSKTITVSSGYVALNATDFDGGSVTVKLYVNGTVQESETGEGESYVSAHAGAFL